MKVQELALALAEAAELTIPSVLVRILASDALCAASEAISVPYGAA